jgi:peptidyl-prolyl cis-trans isomerase D
MLEKFRKFSKTMFAKIFLFIVAIPFVFWGMGGLFSGGNLNTIVKIGKEKVSTDKFVRYIRRNSDPSKNIDKEKIEILLTSFIGEYLMENEQKKYNIILSDKSLAKIIRNQEFFKKDKKFSRVKYEKFLIKNKMSAVSFEESLIKQESRKQLLDFIGGGISPTGFIININYNIINQERSVDVININDLAKKKLNITEEKINEYFNSNKEKYIVIYKSVNLIELSPANLIESNEYSELFFSRIDQIDDLIADGGSLEEIKEKFNLEKNKKIVIDKNGNYKNLNKNEDLSEGLVSKIFKIENIGDVNLIEDNNKYFLVSLDNIENVQRDVTDSSVKKSVVSNISNDEKVKNVLTILSKIRTGNFKKNQFLSLSSDNNIAIKKIEIKNSNDELAFGKDLLSQIYKLPIGKVGLVYNNDFSDAHLVYVDKVKNTKIEKNSDEYEKYTNLSRLKLKGDLYNTYDSYLKNKYNIKINYNALNNIKNYF